MKQGYINYVTYEMFIDFFSPMDLFALEHSKRYDLSIRLRTLWLWFAFSLMASASSSEIFSLC